MYTPSMIAAASVAAALHGLDWTGKSGYGLAGLLDELTRITAIEQVSNVRIKSVAVYCKAEDRAMCPLAPSRFTRLKTDATTSRNIFKLFKPTGEEEGPTDRDARRRCLAFGARRSRRGEIGKKRWNLPFASLDWWLRQTLRGAKSVTGSAREGYSRCRAHVCEEEKNEDPECLLGAGPVCPPSKTAATRPPFRLLSFSPRFLLPLLSFFFSFTIYA